MRALVVVLLVAASCGSDPADSTTIDNATDTTTDDGDEEISEQPPLVDVERVEPSCAPDGAAGFSDDGFGRSQTVFVDRDGPVRADVDLDLAWLDVYCRHYDTSGLVAWAPGSPPCPHHATRLVVLGNPEPLLEAGTKRNLVELLGSLERDNETLGEALETQLGITMWNVDAAATTPVTIAEALAEEGLLAAPDYLVVPSPGRMMFPGSLPMLPSNPGITEPADAGQATSVTVQVLDTGGRDKLHGEIDDYVLSAAPLSYVGGHGQFIQGILERSAAGLEVRHWRVNPQNTLVAFESDLVHAAARAREDHIASGVEHPMLTNLSMGTTVCELPDPADTTPTISAALLTQRVVAKLLLQGAGDHLVAAAGNTRGRDWLAFPAAFSDPTTSQWFESSQLVLEISHPEVLGGLTPDSTDFSQQITAVGATSAPDAVFNDSTYSTEAPWIDEIREGCHESDYPNINYRYPTFPVGYEVQFNEGRAEWCGTSFAAPVVTAEIAVEMARELANN